MVIFFILFSLTVCVILFIRYSFVVVTIVSNSMSPVLNEDDRVLAFRCYPHFFLRKGHIVLVAPPDIYREHSLDVFRFVPYIKRVVGLPGDTVLTRFQEKAGTENSILECENHEQQVWQIPPNHFFVRGDNPNASLDSETWGALPFSDLLGVVIMRLPSTKKAEGQ